MQASKKTRSMVQFSILLAIEAIFCFTPLGSLPAIGPIVATMAIVPVVLTAVLMGTGMGTLMGFFAGLFSFLVWTFSPPNPLIAFVFTPFYSLGSLSGNYWSLFICFVPRILSGTFAGLSYKALAKLFPDGGKGNAISYCSGGAIGSLTNTFLVMGSIYLFFGTDYSNALGIGYELLLGIIGATILTSGIPEAVLNAVAAYFICRAVKKAMAHT